MSEADDPRQKLAKKIAFNRRERREKDPHGFWDMGERELVECMGAGNAVPGSITYEQARLVLEQKRHEADQRAQQSERLQKHTDRLMDELSSPSAPPTDGGFLGLLALIVGVGALIVVVLPTTVARAVDAIVVLAVIAALFLPAVRLPVSRWLNQPSADRRYSTSCRNSRRPVTV